MQIVYKLCDGYQSKEIASMLGKSKATIEGYVRILYAKLNARSRAQVVARAFALGLITEAEEPGSEHHRLTG
jgi:DNA-binding NarL/FixJ family response regulator